MNKLNAKKYQVSEF